MKNKFIFTNSNSVLGNSNSICLGSTDWQQNNYLWSKMMFQRFPWDPRPTRKIKKRRRVTTNKGWTNTQKEMRGDEVLVEVTGLASGTRAQYVRGVWQYIKANHLQTPNDGRRIIPDATLARLMGIEGEQFNAFTMLRYIERHLQKNEDGNGTAWRIQTILIFELVNSKLFKIPIKGNRFVKL